MGCYFLPVEGGPRWRARKGPTAPRSEGFGAVGGGWMAVQQEQAPAAQRGQRLPTYKQAEQISKWRESNVSQVSLCWRRKVQICDGRRLG